MGGGPGAAPPPHHRVLERVWLRKLGWQSGWRFPHAPLQVFLHQHPVHGGRAAQGGDGVGGESLHDRETQVSDVAAERPQPELMSTAPGPLCPSHRENKANTSDCREFSVIGRNLYI